MSRLQSVDEAFVADLRARGTAPSEPTVTSMDLRVEARITYRQLDFWSTTGRLRPVAMVKGKGGGTSAAVEDGGSGWQRRYPASEVKIATLIRRLLAAGLSLPQSHDAARTHAADPDEPIILGPGLALIITDEDDDEPAQAGAR